MYVRDIEAHSHKNCSRLKAINSMCVYSCLSYPGRKWQLSCASIILTPVTCLAVPRSSTLYHDWHDFREKKY